MVWRSLMQAISDDPPPYPSEPYFNQPLNLKFLTTPAMVEWVSACVESRHPKGDLIFRYATLVSCWG